MTAIALDDRPLAGSRRILIVCTTDALNSGMTFTSRERETRLGLGKLPVLQRTAHLKITLTGRHVAGMKLWALGLDGHRAEGIAPAADTRSTSATLDTARLRTVTPFFELAAERRTCPL